MHRNITPASSILPPELSLVSDEPKLFELSQKDKVWDKHRRYADIAATYYRNTEFDDYANRIDNCANFLQMRLVPHPETDELRLKLFNARFCRVRHCPICQFRRAAMWKSKAHKVIPDIIEDYPTYRWLFITLTVKNCELIDLRETIQSMNRAWTRLTRYKSFPAEGWIKSLEVTKGQDGSAHPHFHCLLLVKSQYFGRDYLKQSDWSSSWEKALQSEYEPIVDIRAVKKDQDPKQLIPEILKYCTKESDLLDEQEWFLEFTRQMHKLRMIAVGGILKNYFRELEQEPQDLIGSDDEDDAGDELSYLTFTWRRFERCYRLFTAASESDYVAKLFELTHGFKSSVSNFKNQNRD